MTTLTNTTNSIIIDMHGPNSENLIGVTRGAQLIHVQKEIRSIENNPHLNKINKFVIAEHNLGSFILIVSPSEGLYRELSIPFELTVPINYPSPGNPINARCLENIYHPNIFESGRLCLKYDGTGNLDIG